MELKLIESYAKAHLSVLIPSWRFESSHVKNQTEVFCSHFLCHLSLIVQKGVLWRSSQLT